MMEPITLISVESGLCGSSVVPQESLHAHDAGCRHLSRKEFFVTSLHEELPQHKGRKIDFSTHTPKPGRGFTWFSPRMYPFASGNCGPNISPQAARLAKWQLTM